MEFEPYRLMAFFHVILFVYWLGADLGVFICGQVTRRPNLSPETRAAVRSAGHLIDMGPRTAMVLMLPAGVTLGSQYGVPVSGPALWALWAFSFVWLWMVWKFYFAPQSDIGKLVWKLDMALRALFTVAFLGFGAYCIATGGPVSDGWLIAKIIVFGLIIADGFWLRILIWRQEQIAKAAGGPVVIPAGLRNMLSLSVLAIWFMVAIAAFFGVVKPY
jgi:hypothetical protein